MSKIANFNKLCRKNQKDFNCSLSVFGHSSKVFRDDEKAIELDQGKHLIPWTGNESITIDRYDVRGYLSDLSQYESFNTENTLTNEENHIEELCDNERYRALYCNEEQMYREEGLKRVKPSSNTAKEYGEVFYKYSSSETEAKNSTNLDKLFSPVLKIPPNIVLPSSKNVGQIIDRTANCVAKHGRQMEIIIKARQAKNKKFSFLNSKNDLNPYYEYVLSTKKTGYYRVDKNKPDEETANLLLPQETSVYCVESAPTVAHTNCKPSSECPYSMLVKKIHSFQKKEEMLGSYRIADTNSVFPKNKSQK